LKKLPSNVRLNGTDVIAVVVAAVVSPALASGVGVPPAALASGVPPAGLVCALTERKSTFASRSRTLELVDE